MSAEEAPIRTDDDDALLTLEELCRAVAVEPRWVLQRIDAGLIDASGGDAPPAWRFDAVTLVRVRRMAGVERDFDAVPELAALVADLAEEIAELRRRLSRWPSGEAWP